MLRCWPGLEGRSPAPIGREMVAQRAKNGHSSRADGDSMGTSALDPENGVGRGSGRRRWLRPPASLRGVLRSLRAKYAL